MSPVYALTMQAVDGDHEWKYLFSDNRNAYPDSGVVDGYEYEYLGVPLDRAFGGARIQTGSYIGTGTYGLSNPNSLSFDFNPAFLVVLPEKITSTGTTAGLYMLGGAKTTSYTSGSNDSACDVTWGEKTVSWYSAAGTNSAKFQHNNVEKYFWVAIG